MKLDLNKDQIAIITIIQSYPDTLDNQKRFSAILSDCIPENKALRTALVNAYEEGLIDVIKSGTNPQQTIFQCKKRLENNCGIAAGYANSAVLILAYICGKDDWFEIKEIVSQNQSIKKYFKIKILYKSDHRCWVGYSNSSYSSGFYMTFYKNGMFFTEESFKSSELQQWILNRPYEKVYVAQEDVRRRNIF